MVKRALSATFHSYYRRPPPGEPICGTAATRKAAFPLALTSRLAPYRHVTRRRETNRQGAENDLDECTRGLPDGTRHPWECSRVSAGICLAGAILMP